MKPTTTGLVSFLTGALLPAALLISTVAHAQVTRSDSVLESARSLDVELDSWETAQSRRPLPNGAFEEDLRFAKEIDLAGDVSLTGIWSSRYLTFHIPDTWELEATPELYLDVMRSAQLIPEISAITVWVDDQPVDTFALDGEPGEIWQEHIKLPLVGRQTGHTLQFNAYHRSWMPCELADHPGLWSRLMADSFIRVQYREVAPERNLARWPYPFIDEADPPPHRVILALSPTPDDDELRALGFLASTLGQRAASRKLDLIVHQGALDQAPEGHIIALFDVGAPGALGTSLIALMGQTEDAELNTAAQRLSGGDLGGAGVLALVPRSDDPLHTVLVVAGSDGDGLVDLARMLSSEQGDDLPAGAAEFITAVRDAEPMEARRWSRTMPPESNFDLMDLGHGDLTAVGFRGGSVFIPINRVPDDIPLLDEASLDLVFSHSGQISPANSRLDVLLDGVAIGGVALDQLDGVTRQHLQLDLPAHDLGAATTLEVRFQLVGREQPFCLGETHDQLWGTVHADTKLEVPRAVMSRIHDLSLLRHGGYPFGIVPDLGDTIIVLPTPPTETDVQLFTWLTAELGRVARGNRFAYDVHTGAPLPEGGKGKDIVVIDTAPGAPLITSLELYDEMWFLLDGAEGVEVNLASKGAVSFAPDPQVAFIEQLQLPWQPGRSGLVIYAPDIELFERVGPCPARPPLFDQLGGRVTRIASCDDVVQVPETEDLVVGEDPLPVEVTEGEAQRRSWHRILLWGALILLVLVLLGLWWRTSRQREAEYEEMDL
jgi:hypothetical protein